ncbi:hypothetical protein BJ508DRAFT_302154 [Ascobolus immersus RN42]|uniref:Uncharacterized protein n=1 Tax=Ascobolus immersus RN42 TaxID=1160509 RepID=A0A3N4ING0_ASCIM|nr:hypothetical protein BJ508DRAFT_302154 [Ascobolus immersus RN42]
MALLVRFGSAEGATPVAIESRWQRLFLILGTTLIIMMKRSAVKRLKRAHLTSSFSTVSPGFRCAVLKYLDQSDIKPVKAIAGCSDSKVQVAYQTLLQPWLTSSDWRILKPADATYFSGSASQLQYVSVQQLCSSTSIKETEQVCNGARLLPKSAGVRLSSV